MSAGGAMPAGSGRPWRLDPLSLPVHYKANDAGADERTRLVELHRERVVMRRAVRGIRMEVTLPVSAFLGVAIRVVPPNADFAGAVAVTLEHRDPGLSIPLYVTADGAEVSAEWQLWARVLGLPMLVAGADDVLRAPFGRIGHVHVGQVAARRRRSGPIKTRRPSICLRRRPGVARAGAPVHRGEREIIARD